MSDFDDEFDVKPRRDDKWYHVLDGYGNALRRDPKVYKKSLGGAVVSTLFRLILLTLVIINLVKLFTQEQYTSTGEVVTFNLRKTKEQYVLDFPSMNFDTKFDIVFFDKDVPSLQKILMTDMNGYNPDQTSNQEEIQTANAIYKKVSVPLGSFDDDFSNISSQFDIGQRDLFTINNEQTPTKYPSETLKIIYLWGGILGTYPKFYPHDAHLFIRLDRNQLKTVKPCQLQMSLFNDHESKLASDLKQNPLSTLSSSDRSWKPERFDDKGRLQNRDANLFYVTRSLETPFNADQNDDSVAAASLNWKFGINYVNNFVSFSDKLTCQDAPNEDIIPFSRTARPQFNKTTLLLPTTHTAQQWCEPKTIETCFPFEVIALHGNAYEVIKVTNIVGNSLVIERDADMRNRADFTLPLTRRYSDLWTCSIDDFGTDNGCQCNCGMLDPDCWENDEGNPNWCDGYYGTNVAVVLSEPCSRFVTPGEVNVGGFINDQVNGASLANECPICPNDEMNDGKPVRNRDGKYVCNYAAQGILAPVDAFRNYFNTTGPRNSITVEVNGSPFPVAKPLQLVVNQGEGKKERAVGFQAEPPISVNNKYFQNLTITEGGNRLIDLTVWGEIVTQISTKNSWAMVKMEHPGAELAGEELVAIKKIGNAYRRYDIHVSDIESPVFNFYNGDRYHLIRLANIAQSGAARVAEIGLSTTVKNVDLDARLVTLQLETGKDFRGLTNFEVIIATSDGSQKAFGRINDVISSWNCTNVTRISDGVCDCYCTDFVGGGRDFDPDCEAGDQCIGIAAPRTYRPLQVLRADTLSGYFGPGWTVTVGKQKDSDEPVYITKKNSVKVLRVAEEYGPNDRFRPTSNEPFTSPEQIDAEVALFTVPHRKNFNDINLCANITTNDVTLKDGAWEIDSSRYSTITSCERTSYWLERAKKVGCVPFTSERMLSMDRVYRHECMEAMPPTFGMKFTNTLPLNSKWKTSNGQLFADDPTQRDSEYSFDYQFRFSFSHSPHVEDIQNQFIENLKAGGDTDQEGRNYFFHGANFYKSGVLVDLNGIGLEGSVLLPASAPMLKITNILNVDKEATKSYMKKLRAKDIDVTGWDDVEEDADYDSLLDSFEELELVWDVESLGGDQLNQTLPIVPGFQYTFETTLSIVPRYDFRFFTVSTYDIKAWKTSVVSTSVTKTSIDAFDSNDAIVRFRVKINNKVSQTVVQYIYSIKDFIDDLGSAIALLAVGVIFMKLIHMFGKTEYDDQFAVKKRTEVKVNASI